MGYPILTEWKTEGSHKHWKSCFATRNTDYKKAKDYFLILAESGCRQSPIDVIDSETQQDSSLQPVEASFGPGEEYKLVLHIFTVYY